MREDLLRVKDEEENTDLEQGTEEVIWNEEVQRHNGFR